MELSDLLICLAVVVALVALYGLWSWPVNVAKARNHPRREAILMCATVGLLLWPAWVVALVWAYACESPTAQAIRPEVQADQPDTRESLDAQVGAALEDARAEEDTESCENCGRLIGRLETPHVWRGHIVCASCRSNLATA